MSEWLKRNTKRIEMAKKKWEWINDLRKHMYGHPLEYMTAYYENILARGELLKENDNSIWQCKIIVEGVRDDLAPFCV